MAKPINLLSRILLAMAIGSLLLATGCASTGTSTTNQPIIIKLAKFKSATIEIKSTITKPPEKLDEFRALLESRIIARLRQRHAFDRIYPAAASDSPSDLMITITITRIRDVDNFDRVMWGAFAGQARTEATVDLVERATEKLIGSSKIVGKSSGGSVFAGTTSEAVDRVADEVITVICSNH